MCSILYSQYFFFFRRFEAQEKKFHFSKVTNLLFACWQSEHVFLYSVGAGNDIGDTQLEMQW